MTDKPVLDVRNLSTVFNTDEGEVRAVDRISFQLAPGETLGIVGESGSGKSVTSLSLMRLIPNPPGRIIAGEMLYSDRAGNVIDLAKVPVKEMRKYRGNEIAMVFQEPMTSLNPVFTCGNQVMEAIVLHQKVSKAEARERTLALFKEVQLPRPEQIMDSYPHQLSGGQKQRVMIAMAISCQPSVLIADEPTTALDVTVQKTILQLLQRLQAERGMSMLFITHDLGVIAEIADRVLVMYKGKVVEQGRVYDIFANPQHAYTKGLLACRPSLDRKLRVLPTMRDFMREEPDGTMVPAEKSVRQVLSELAAPAGAAEERQQKLYTQKPILQIKDVQTYFPVRKGIFGRITDYVKAVDGVSFDVYPGEVLGLVGESGCGKTTLGRTILRLIEPSGGEIHFEEKDIRSLDSSEMRRMRKHMQIVFQDPYSSLNPRMTIGAAIMEPMQVHHLHGNDKNRRAKVVELLDRVGLSSNVFNRYPHEFSGGQRQRVSIARALAVEPRFIICDESVSALDVSVQAQVLNLINELRDELGLTYIFISHDLSVVKFMSDRMVVMEAGKIVEMGPAEAIYENPQSAYTRKLIDAIPQGRLEDIAEALTRRKISL
jgi:peptide/nickel transport system ATP-binding protein